MQGADFRGVQGGRKTYPLRDWGHRGGWLNLSKKKAMMVYEQLTRFIKVS
jgi:hypothetical protein